MLTLLCLVTRGWRKDEHRTILLFQAELLDVWCKSKSFWFKLLAQNKWADKKPQIRKSRHRSDCSSPSTAAMFSCDRLRSSELLHLTQDKREEAQIYFTSHFGTCSPFLPPLSYWASHLCMLTIQPCNHQCPPTFILLLSLYVTSHWNIQSHLASCLAYSCVISHEHFCNMNINSNTE